MAVNSELIETIKASQLPKLANPTTGDLIHAQGDDLSTTSLSFFLDKINSGIYGTLKINTVVPTTGYQRYDVKEANTYTNVTPNITVTQDELDENFVFITITNGIADKLLSKKPNSKILTFEQKPYNKGSQVFGINGIYEAKNDTVPEDIPGVKVDGVATNWVKKISDYRADIDKSLNYFLSQKVKSMQITDWSVDTYLRKDGTTLSAGGNKAILNIDVTGYNKLQYNCFPAVGTVALQYDYCSILGKKFDGTLEVVRQMELIGSQVKVTETYDVSKYLSISISIGDFENSKNQTPDIKLYSTDPNGGSNKIDSVKEYIDTKMATQANIILNSISTFTADNVTVNGGAAIANGIVFCSGNSTVDIKENTLNEASEIYIDYQETSASDVSIGFRSYNEASYFHNVFVRYNTSGANFGKLEVRAKAGLNYSKLSTDSNTNYTMGDVLRLGIIRTGLTYKFYVQNLTKSWRLDIMQTTDPLGNPFTAHNSAFPQTIVNSGSCKVVGYKHICFLDNIENAIVGDSITFGQAAITEAQRWASLVKGNNLVMGGGADITNSVLMRINEIIKLKPRRALLMIGGNDILFAIATNVWQGNYTSITNQLKAANIEVVHCLPTPRGGATELISFIESDFPYDLKIDTNTPLCKNGNPEILKDEYNQDNIHPNSAGMAKIAEVVNNIL